MNAHYSPSALRGHCRGQYARLAFVLAAMGAGIVAVAVWGRPCLADACAGFEPAPWVVNAGDSTAHAYQSLSGIARHIRSAL